MSSNWHGRTKVALAALLLGIAGCAQEAPEPPVTPEPANPQAQEAPTGLPLQEIADVDIPYHKTVLENGLTVIVHEDHKTPIVSVTVWYHVGSKNEVAGKTGFAHLFEHLMFNGTEHFNDDYFRPLEQVGATEMNGTTSRDRTNYFQNVPTPALDLALWMESDRMGHLLGAIDQGKLDEQRAVVKNEKRQRESAPYGQVWEQIAQNTYPAGHPYSWTTIGSMEDLDRATVEDVHEWFKTYYGPSNAVLVIAGDVDTETAIAKARQAFGAIPPGPPVTRPAKNFAPLAQPRRITLQDRVAQGRLYAVWNVPEWGHADLPALDLATTVLGAGKTSRLHRRLVEQEQLATDVSLGVGSGELGSQIYLVVTARPDVDLARIEAVANEELSRFAQEGPSPDELERARMRALSGFLRGIEKVGGFAGKAQILAESQTFSGNPEFWKTDLTRLREATPGQLQATVQKWLGDNRLTITVEPYPAYAALGEDVDRATLPATAAPPDLDFPALERTRLDNGLQIVLARRPNAPTVELDLLVPAGFASDDPSRSGLAGLTLDMLEEGSSRRDAQQIAAETERLGATIGVSATLDAGIISLSSLRETLEPSLALFAEIVRDPAFPEDRLALLKQQRLADIAQEKTQPSSMAQRVLPPLLYGPEHPYGQPLTGSGYESVVQDATVESLRDFYKRHVHPKEAVLVAVGDIDLDTLRQQVEQALGSWTAPEDAVVATTLPTPPSPDKPRIFLIDRPDYSQSMIMAGELVPPTGAPEDLAFRAVNAVLGGMFTSRLNFNLREQKGWAYGAGSRLIDAKGHRPWMLHAPVQQDKTAAAMREISREIHGIIKSSPISSDELDKAQKNMTLKLPGQFETAAQVASGIQNITLYDLSDDYYDRFVQDIRALTPDQTSQVARDWIDPSRLTWVVVGDLRKIEPEIRALGWGEVEIVDADGRPRNDAAAPAE
jgi:zinc protease